MHLAVMYLPQLGWHNDMVNAIVYSSTKDDLGFPNQVAIAPNGYFQRKGAPKLLPMFATNFMAAMEATTWQYRIFMEH